MKWAKTIAVTAPLLLGTATLGSAAGLMVLGSAPAVAAAQQPVSAKVGKPLQEAQKLAQQKKFTEAMAKVKEAAAVSGKSAHEEKVINEITAFVAVNAGDYATAAKAYEASLNGEMKKDELGPRLTTLVQLNYQLKQYAKAEHFASRYLKEIGYDADLALLLAQTQYVQKNYGAAEQSVGDLILRSGTPKEEWLKLRMSCQHQLQQRDAVIATLEQLLTRYPSADYWKDMLAYVHATPGITDRTNLEIYRIKRVTTGLAAAEYIEMAELGLALGQYGEALELLQSGFDSGVLGSGRDQRLLALTRNQAHEDKAGLPALAKEAAAAPTGEALVRLGEAWLNYGQYTQAEQAIADGLRRGGVTSGDEAQLHRGIALLKQKKMVDAITAFKEVPAGSPLNQVARLWAIYAAKA